MAWFRQPYGLKFHRPICNEGTWILMLGGLTNTHIFRHAWWRHQMETFSALLALCAGNSPVNGEFPSQKPVTRSFDVFCHLCLNKRLSKHSWGWWFETPSGSLWRHRHDVPDTVFTILSRLFSLSYKAIRQERLHRSTVPSIQVLLCLVTRLLRHTARYIFKLSIIDLRGEDSDAADWY